jgi:hypothetical protein
MPLNRRGMTDALRRMSPEDRWRVLFFVAQMLAGATRLTINGKAECWQAILKRQVRKQRRARRVS